MLASSLLIRRSSSSRALAFRKSDIKVVRPLMVDMFLSVEKIPPPPPGLRIVVARFRLMDDAEAETGGQFGAGTCTTTYIQSTKQGTYYINRAHHIRPPNEIYLTLLHIGKKGDIVEITSNQIPSLAKLIQFQLCFIYSAYRRYSESKGEFV
jgi:hypothetical protein